MRWRLLLTSRRLIKGLSFDNFDILVSAARFPPPAIRKRQVACAFADSEPGIFYVIAPLSGRSSGLNSTL